MKSVEKLFFLCFLFEAVLCRYFSIDLPERIEALRGTCVLIPCSFEIEEQYDKDLQRPVSGLWYRGDHKDENKVFISTATEGNKIEGKITGDLLMKNCTTIFYNIKQTDSGNYYFRLEAQGPLKYNYGPSVSINVRASPTRPSITLYKEDQGEVEGQNEVVEGRSVSLICSARAPCSSHPPIFTWSFIPEEKSQEQNQNSSFSSSKLNFRASHLHHGLDMTCSATYRLHSGTNTSAQSSLMIQVLYAPKNTTISATPSASVLLGGSVTLWCSSDANPAVLSYIWYRENGELIGRGENLTIIQTAHKHHGLYYCRAHNQHGHQNSSLFLDVQYAPKNTILSVCPSASVPSFGSVRCSSDDDPAVQNRELNGTRSNLTFNVTGIKQHGLNICSTHNQLGGQNSSLCLEDPPKNTTISVSPSASVLLGSSVCLRCSSDANPAVLNYTWYRENGELIGRGENLTIIQTAHKHHGLYYCRAHNQHGDQNSSLFLDVQYAPQISLSSSCNSSQESIDCFCEVQGNPSPTLEWLQTGQKINSSEVKQSEIFMGFRSFISIPKSHRDPLPTLQCVTTNQLGVSTQHFSFIEATQSSAGSTFKELKDFHPVSMVIGVAAGASVMLLLCLLYLWVRKRHHKPSQSENENTAGLILNDRVQFQEEDGIVSESLDYSTIKFPNGAGNEIRGLSSLTAEYAAVHYDSKNQMLGQEEESAPTREVQKGKKETVKKTVIPDSISEEVTYGNIVRHPKPKKTQIDLDVAAEGEKSKKPEQIQSSSLNVAEEIYAQVKK